MPMWRKKARLPFILNEPEVLSSLLARAAASLPLTRKLCVWSQLPLRSPNAAPQSFPVCPWMSGSKFWLHGIHSQMNYPPPPPTLRLPSCISYQRQEQLRGGIVLPICICLNHSTGWWLNRNPRHLLTLLPWVSAHTRWCLLNFAQTHCT